MKKIAIVLAAGRGKRMNSEVAKQYLLLQDRPVLYYSLKVFEDSDIDEIYLVTSTSECEYCKREIVEKYGFIKVTAIVAGGAERYHSVYNGLCAIMQSNDIDCDVYVYIHDGARPFVDKEMLARLQTNVQRHGSAVAAVSSKDTIKIADSDGFVVDTPNRSTLWQIQTPQVFKLDKIYCAYSKLMAEEELNTKKYNVTDDAMVMETFSTEKIKLVDGDYKNIKLTTPEDLLIANVFLDGN